MAITTKAAAITANILPKKVERWNVKQPNVRAMIAAQPYKKDANFFMILWFMIVNVKVLWPEILGYFGQKRLKWLGEWCNYHITPYSLKYS